MKQEPVLTATTCSKFHNILLALELLTGKTIRVIEFDFNECRGRVLVDREHAYHITVTFHGRIDANFEIELGYCTGWNIVKILPNGTVKVLKYQEYPGSRPRVYQVGTSLSDRHEEPVEL